MTKQELITKRHKELQIYNIIIALQNKFANPGAVLDTMTLVGRAVDADADITAKLVKQIMTMGIKYTPIGNEWKFIVCNLENMSCKEACELLDIARKTFYNYLAMEKNIVLTFEESWYAETDKLLSYFSDMSDAMLKGMVTINGF